MLQKVFRYRGNLEKLTYQRFRKPNSGIWPNEITNKLQHVTENMPFTTTIIYKTYLIAKQREMYKFFTSSYKNVLIGLQKKAESSILYLLTGGRILSIGQFCLKYSQTCCLTYNCKGDKQTQAAVSHTPNRPWKN